MGAAWRGPKQRDIEKITEIIGAVKGLGLETCATLGMLKPGQAEQRQRQKRPVGPQGAAGQKGPWSLFSLY